MNFDLPEPLPLTCPYCGADIELEIDTGGASRQSYVEDCPVCCNPWQVQVVRDRDGEWHATLRTSDD
jgi:transposase-like protein